jgi:hypothetical protein
MKREKEYTTTKQQSFKKHLNFSIIIIYYIII